jgi:RNA polymerase sigma-70 factor, ECF subfamily
MESTVSDLSPTLALASAGQAPDQRLRTLVDEHFHFVWRSVRRLGVSQADADDAVQKVYLIASDKLAHIAIGSERSFLFGVALRVASHLRRGYRRNPLVLLDAEGCDAAPPPDELVDQKRLREMVDRVLDDLPLELRTVLVLFECEQLTTPEISKLLEIPLGTAASRLRRGRELFLERVRMQQCTSQEGRRKP